MDSKDTLNSKRIAKNTLFLYFRTFFVMSVSIYTSRVLLDILGFEDYGIYNAVGGFVSMFSLLSGTLTVATQRFLSFELGKDSYNEKTIFSTAVTIHLILAALIFIIFESVGLWFLNAKLNIPNGRLVASNWVYQCSILTFCVNLLSIPYNAAIIAHERMSAFAYISILEVVLKLAMIYSLTLIDFDHLIVYAVFMLVIAIILRLIYSIYCVTCFQNCRYDFSFDYMSFKQMLSFSGWNFIGSSSAILNTQGINILINLFFGVVYNAARGVTDQIGHAINIFVNNFMMAINPQITKNYAAHNYAYLNNLIVRGAKYSFFLFWMVALPIYVEADNIVKIWLKEVPPYTVTFLKYTIIYSLLQTFSQTLYAAMLSTGNIKKYQIVVGTLSLLAFPFTYFFYMSGLPVDAGYLTTILFSFVCLFARLFLIREMIPLFTIQQYLKAVIFKSLVIVSITFTLLRLIHIYIIYTNIWWELIIIVFWASFVNISIYLVIGMDSIERHYLYKLIKRKIWRWKS